MNVFAKEGEVHRREVTTRFVQLQEGSFNQQDRHDDSRLVRKNFPALWCVSDSRSRQEHALEFFLDYSVGVFERRLSHKQACFASLGFCYY